MRSRLVRGRAAAERLLESNAFLAFGFAVMAGTVALLVGQYLTLHRYDAGAAPWPVEHFFWSALVIAGFAALIGWGVGKLLPA